MYGYGYMDMDMDMDMDVDMDMDMDIDVYHRPNLELVCNVGSRLFYFLFIFYLLYLFLFILLLYIYYIECKYSMFQDYFTYCEEKLPTQSSYRGGYWLHK